MDGSSEWIWLSASRPLRAVPTTRNSSEPSTISLMSFRMNALSSTTRTVRLEDTVADLQGSDLEPAIAEVEVHAATVLPADVLGHQRNAGILERLAGRDGIALAHVDPAGGDERGEHARAAGDLGGDLGARTAPPHLLDEKRDRRRGELGRVGGVARQRWARDENVRE